MEFKKTRLEGNQLKVTIPKDSGIQPGDYVAIISIKKLDLKIPIEKAA